MRTCKRARVSTCIPAVAIAATATATVALLGCAHAFQSPRTNHVVKPLTPRSVYDACSGGACGFMRVGATISPCRESWALREAGEAVGREVVAVESGDTEGSIPVGDRQYLTWQEKILFWWLWTCNGYCCVQLVITGTSAPSVVILEPIFHTFTSFPCYNRVINELYTADERVRGLLLVRTLRMVVLMVSE